MMPYVVVIVAVLLVALILIVVLEPVLRFAIVVLGVCIAGAVVAGAVRALVLPVQVLAGVEGYAHVLRPVTPDRVKAGGVLVGLPRGLGRFRGWDWAWPTYLPYQSREDLLSLGRAWFEHTASMRQRIPAWGESRTGAVVAGIALSCYLIGFSAVTLGLAVAFGVAGLVVSGFVRAYRAVLAANDARRLRRRRAVTLCPTCYAQSPYPSYRCDRPGCGEIHRRLLPGPFGARTRLCGCGQRLPNTVTSAALQLAPLCPFCEEDLAPGSGARRTARVCVVGAMGSGKTRFLGAAIVALHQRLAPRGGGVVALTPRDRAHLDRLCDAIVRGAPVVQTPDEERPAGLPLLVLNDGDPVELQLMDVAGGRFRSGDDVAELRYLRSAQAFALVIDPLALPGLDGDIATAPAILDLPPRDPADENLPALVFDRLGSSGADLRRRALAVVVTKADILARLPHGQVLTDGPADDAAVRAWLTSMGSGPVVNLIECTFGEVCYFLVDSMGSIESTGKRTDPLTPLRWLLRREGVALPPGTAVPAGVGPAGEPRSAAVPAGSAPQPTPMTFATSGPAFPDPSVTPLGAVPDPARRYAIGRLKWLIASVGVVALGFVALVVWFGTGDRAAPLWQHVDAVVAFVRRGSLIHLPWS